MWLLLLIISIVSTVGAIIMQKYDLFGVEGQELGAYDGGLSFWTNKVERSKNVTLVLIDEKTFSAIDRQEVHRSKFGTWPYQRNIWAYLLNYFMECGARAVVFDFIMTEETNGDPDMLNSLAELRSHQIPFYSAFDFDVERPELPKVDAKNRVLHPEEMLQIEAQLKPMQPQSIDDLFKEEGGGPAKEDGEKEEGSGNPAKEDGGGHPAKEQTEIKAPPPLSPAWLQLAAQSLAFPIKAQGFALPTFPENIVFEDDGKTIKKTRPLNPFPPMSSLWPYAQFGIATTESYLKGNDDGKMRRTGFGVCDGQNCYATISVAIAAGVLKAESVELTREFLKIGPRTLPIDQDGTAGINYGGAYDERFKTLSMIYPLEDAIWRQENREKMKLPLPKYGADLKDKIVFVAVAKGDNRPTPFEKDPPAVVKHAAEVENLISGRFITDAPYWVSVILAFLLACLSIMVALFVDSPLLEIGWPILVFFGFYVIPGYFATKYQIHVLSVMPALAGSFASVLASSYKNFFADKEREEMRNLFSHYMEKDLVEQMVEGEKLPSLTGERKQITIVFCDLKDFSTIAENAGLSLEIQMKMLNLYLNRMSKILVEEGGCLDKYVENEIRAFFGAPVSFPDHALRACRAALRMKQEGEQLKEEFQKQGWPTFSLRIGLNTDEVLVGNMGGEQLIDYTALGEGVRLAAWLKEATSSYSCTILIGANTYEQVKEQMEVREMGKTQVLANAESMIYELVSQ